MISARSDQCLVTLRDALVGFGGGVVVETLWAPPLAFVAPFGFAGVSAVVAFLERGFLAD
jgi:hypothetical protein